MKLLLLVTFLGYACADCPAWRPWRPETGCIWMKGEDGKISFNDMRDNFIEACGISIDTESIPDVDLDITVPDKCGYCSFKMKCRNRDGMDQGCFPIDAEKTVCNEYSDVCMLPKLPKFNTCKWGIVGAMLSQCVSNRPDVAEWKREGFRKASEFFPQQNCIEKGDECACCCHPYKPNAEGTECVPVQPKPECQDFRDWNEWTECLWFDGDLKNVFKKVKNHCFPGGGAPEKDGEEALKKVEMPGDFQMPDKCGFCSFKFRCQKRESDGKPGCFPVKADKRACGPDECEGCGDVCTIPHMTDAFRGDLEPCEWQKKMITIVKARLKKYMKKMKNYWRKRGFLSVLKYMPFGSCKQVGNECKCCCHPYEPSADGSQCVVKDICKIPSDLGLTWSVNP